MNNWEKELKEAYEDITTELWQEEYDKYTPENIKKRMSELFNKWDAEMREGKDTDLPIEYFELEVMLKDMLGEDDDEYDTEDDPQLPCELWDIESCEKCEYHWCKENPNYKKED